MTKSLILHSLITGVVISVLLGLLAPQIVGAEANEVNIAWNSESLTKIDRLTKCGIDKASYGVARTTTMLLTAYTSDPWETDDTPTITASGKTVYDGIVANNGLKFGTKIRIPELYGNKVFVVEDRMHKRKGTKMMDIWMEQKKDAREFGVKLTTVEILES